MARAGRIFLLRGTAVLGCLLLAASCLGVSLFAQVFQVGGGTSTLYQAGGGSFTVHAPSYDFTMGAGTIDGHIFEGAQLVRATARAKYVFGDDRIDFRLPTDIFDASHFLLARGAGMTTTRRQTDITAFVGATATAYNSPLFDGAKLNDPAAILFLKRRISPHWQLFSDTVASKKMTAIEAVQWQPRPKINLGLAAGAGANQPYLASSLDFSRRWIDLDAAYIGAGQQFHRVDVTSPLFAEPDGGNLLVTLKPYSIVTFTGAHQNFLVPAYPGTANVRSSVDEGAAGLRVFKTGLNGTFFRSTYQGESNHAASFSATRDFTDRLRVMANYLASRPKDSTPTNSFISTFSETLTSRLSVSENITNSGGHTGINFGGQLLSNFVTVNAAYETFYVPANNSTPFEQSLVVDVRMNLFGRLVLHGSSFVDPMGRLRYTVDAHTAVSRGRSAAPTVEHLVMGHAVMRGCVVDSEHQLIEGAALLIDKRLVYTDSSGCFFARENKPRTHTLQIVLTEFLAGGNWHVVSAPSTITSSPEGDNLQTPIKVVLAHVTFASSKGPVVDDHPLK